MGVHGLWRLIEPSGKPVPLETLENKVLAVDVSIWLHQAIKGFQDSKGAPVPNAHLLGIYHRVCKLLYFKVKPVFIFDGGVPVLKKQTIAKRHQQKSRNISEAKRLQKQLLGTLLKHSAISKVLSEKTKASLTLPKKLSKHENIYALPPSELDSTVSSSEDDEMESTTDSSPVKHWDLHTIDMSNVHFKSLPVDVRHEILTELKETRKQNSWGRLHELPKQSDDFSIYQMRRLLKRQAVQSALEDAEKEMGGHSLSMAELESILKDHGVAVTNDVGKRIASDENTRYLLIKDIKQAMENARKAEQINLESEQEENADKIKVQETAEEIKTEEISKTKADLEFEEDLQKAIALSLQEEPSTSKTDYVTSISDPKKKLEFSFLENFNDADFQSDSNEEMEEVPVKKTFSSAQNYMMEYSGLTPNEIAKILIDKNRKPLKKSKRKKDIEKELKIDTVEIISDSDGSTEFIEVSLKDPENDVLRGASSGIIENCINKSSNAIEHFTKNKMNTAFPGISSNEFMVLQRDSENNNNITKMETTEKYIVNPCKSNEKSQYENVAVTSASTDSNILLEVPKTDIKNDTDIKTIEETNKCLVNLLASNKITDVLAKNVSSEEVERRIDIDIMSDSDSSSSIEFLEVSENKPANNSMEIVINPNQHIKDDDLFGDVFQENKECHNKESLQIVIRPQASLDDDLFSDVFDEKVTVIEQETSTPFLSKHTLETKRTLEVMKKDEVFVIQDMEKSKTGEEGVQFSKKELTANIENESTNVTAVNESYSKTSRIVKRLENMEIENEIKTIEKQKLNVEQMKKLKNDLQKEQVDLLIEKSTRERMASNITDQMSQEAQDLLELFGVPYIVAPMEAEAQCAFLDEIELTDGTITDDSDIWLFGGRTVYKNFFNQSKYVMEFKAEDIKHNFKLTREQMILFALLVGSDYTTGIQGVGPVTALEILAAFPPSQSKEFSLSHAQLISGLKEFRSWFNKGKTAGPGRSALKNKLNNISFTDNFPSLQVVQAYLEPTVETSKDKFSWGKPNFLGLKEFAREKFGWSAKKAEEILKPVIKRVEENRVQKSIKDFFKTVHKVHSHTAENKMSKRVKIAVDRIGKTPDELVAEEMETLSKTTQKRTRKKKNDKNNQKTEEKDIQSKPSRKRAKQKNEDTSDSSKVVNSTENIESVCTEQLELPKQKKTRRKSNKQIQTTAEAVEKPTTGKSSEEDQIIDEDTNELEKYENIAIELKKRRQRKNDLTNKDDIHKKKQNRPHPKKILPTENIPKVLEEDEEIQNLKATTSRSLKRVEEIDQEVKNELNQEAKKKRLPDFHKREVIHQKLRDKSDLLRNKLKAIEVFRKSNKGPGYVKKQGRIINLPKENAELSENSSDE